MARSQISKGSQGSDVKTWQNYLMGLGYDLGSYGADGIFGDKTYAATRKYQQDRGLDVDGIVGTNTWGSMGTGKTNTTTTPPAATQSGFTYNPYTESAAVKNAGTAAQNAANAVANYNPFSYGNEGLYNDVMNKILNREKFSYDLNGDALYQQYKDKYMQQGKMAMQDTMGQAAAMTGGYGNSYAATAGNQAYQAHLENLNDIVPELYQMAYDKYNQEGQDLYNQFGLLQSDRSQKYGEWEAGYNRALADRDYTRGVYESERSYDYGKYTDGRDFAYGQHRDSVADAQWQQAYDEGIRQFNLDLQERQRQFNANNAIDLAHLELQKKNSTVVDDKVKEDDPTPTVDPNSAAIKAFQSKLSPESTHDAIARQMYGPYSSYVALQIYQNTQLSEAEKMYLIQYYNISESSLQYLRDKGYDIK